MIPYTTIAQEAGAITVGRLGYRVWKTGLAAGLILVAFLLGLTPAIAGFEFSLFRYVVQLPSSANDLTALTSIQYAPRWALLLVYALMMFIYAHPWSRKQTMGLSLQMSVLILFGLLMLEFVLAAISHYFLPLMTPALIMLVTSSLLWLARVSRYPGMAVLADNRRAVAEIRTLIESGDLKSAFIRLRQCPYSEEVLEAGYQLGLSLESSKQWSSALNLYRWLSAYDPGLEDFVTRLEELRNNRGTVLELARKRSLPESAYPAIGSFRLLRKIAKGSTSVVYEATDMRTHNRVALKVLTALPDEKLERSRINHWLHEAEIVSQMDHRNIVKIHDAETHGNHAYIAMDYISGYSMSLRLRKREYLTASECFRISKAMLKALIAAHGHDIVHGDIKPANIIYDEIHDTYILTDFGAAYCVRDRRHGENTIVGTPAYMSPEQLEGKRLDGRSDLFSLAVTLCHLVTGHQPFNAATLPALKQKIIKDEPDIGHLSLPGGLIEVILKALQKKTYMRFADGQQMLTAVEFCESQLGTAKTG